MPLPSTATEVEMMMEIWRCQTDDAVDSVRVALQPWFDRCIERIFYKPRPHTDDMIQMLVDMGVDVPGRSLPDIRDLTFTWQNWETTDEHHGHQRSAIRQAGRP